jgi:hypothetical protein
MISYLILPRKGAIAETRMPRLPGALVASAHWQWSEGEQPAAIGIRLSTDAYALQDARLLKGRQIHNRPEDLAWAEQKLAWLWQASRAAGPMPPVGESAEGDRLLRAAHRGFAPVGAQPLAACLG